MATLNEPVSATEAVIPTLATKEDLKRLATMEDEGLGCPPHKNPLGLVAEIGQSLQDKERV